METEPLRAARDPGCPTVKEVEDHRSRGHLPYRTWCKWCNLGRGRGLQHRKSPGSRIPIVGLDYFFITEGGVKKKEELGLAEGEAGKNELEDARHKGDIVKCIVVRCSSTKVVLAHVVPCKGPDEDGIVTNSVVEDIHWLGHTKVIVKADGEPAIQALVEQVLRAGRVDCKDLDQMTKENPAAYDSQSSGSTEVGVRMVRGLFRTVKLCLEARLGKLIPCVPPRRPLDAGARVSAPQHRCEGHRRPHRVGEGARPALSTSLDWIRRRRPLQVSNQGATRATDGQHGSPRSGWHVSWISSRVEHVHDSRQR